MLLQQKPIAVNEELHEPNIHVYWEGLDAAVVELQLGQFVLEKLVVSRVAFVGQLVVVVVQWLERDVCSDAAASFAVANEAVEASGDTFVVAVVDVKEEHSDHFVVKQDFALHSEEYLFEFLELPVDE